MQVVKPSLEEVSAALLGTPTAPARGNTIPVYTALPAELLTPVAAYLRLTNGAKLGEESFLLESVSGGERVARYSFLGSRPFATIRTGPSCETTGDPLRVLENRLSEFKYIPVAPLSAFTGGAIGYIAYDCIQYFEPRTACEVSDPLGIPESVMMLCDSMVVFDQAFQTVYCISHVHVGDNATPETVAAQYDEAVRKVHELAATISVENTPLPEQGPVERGVAVSNVGKEGYTGFVRKLREHILEGQIFQAVPSQRLRRPTNLHPFNCYRKLRQINPSPYMFYIDCGDAQLVGASPETLCKVDDGKVSVHAIAGTLPRGRTPEEDEANAAALLASEKDRAEHIMLVDLARNDISRVCDPRTTTVETLMQVERFSHVIHLTSRVTGRLRDDRSKYDALRSIFPAGTVSGSPKIRAIELVYGLEKERRGVYAGAVGRVGFSPTDLDVCIALRTMVFKDGVAYLQAGGGIVYDSVEEDEYMETLNKLGSNVRCLDMAEEEYAAQ
ncbi:anthranilate synthase [Malassezia cuniculi]|uniref:anthranilate synthase n=1 Tax=Malassezia cuniculi TaxID=948313 RepID=A0AAF0EX44_9BASI|nr:anthranilate synthase [Malassezia cuniculi]